jgi:hypothetical protein
MRRGQLLYCGRRVRRCANNRLLAYRLSKLIRNRFTRPLGGVARGDSPFRCIGSGRGVRAHDGDFSKFFDDPEQALQP